MFRFKIHERLADTIPIIQNIYLKGILINDLHISNNSIFKKWMLYDKELVLLW